VRCVREIEVVGFMRIWSAMALFVPIFAEVRYYFAGSRNACDLVVMWAGLATRKGRPARRALLTGCVTAEESISNAFSG
jgi:hypothetical protein